MWAKKIIMSIYTTPVVININEIYSLTGAWAWSFNTYTESKIGKAVVTEHMFFHYN